MKKITFLELARKVLKEEEKPLTVEEIWEIAQKKDYEVATKGKTPWRTIGAQIYVNIRDNDDSPFIKIDSKPRKFFLKELASEEDLKRIREKEEKVVEAPTKTKYSEKDLHPLVTYFAYTYMGLVHTKTIKHQKSSRKTYAQWLHPDLVGVYFTMDEWTPEVWNFGMVVGGRLAKLYSFELKKELTFSNIRESFFQAVSNSSWANEGYLVAPKIAKDEEFMLELKRLSTSFDIGIIKIDIEDPDSSDTLFPAKFKAELDGDTINKLAGENADFKEFITRIKNDLSSMEVIKEKYDQVYDAEKLKEMLKQ